MQKKKGEHKKTLLKTALRMKQICRDCRIKITMPVLRSLINCQIHIGILHIFSMIKPIIIVND